MIATGRYPDPPPEIEQAYARFVEIDTPRRGAWVALVVMTEAQGKSALLVNLMTAEEALADEDDELIRDTTRELLCTAEEYADRDLVLHLDQSDRLRVGVYIRPPRVNAPGGAT